VRTHLANGASIESAGVCPRWNKLPGVKLDARKAPNSNVRGALFSKIFAGNKLVMNMVAVSERPVNEADFTFEALQKRNPEYMAIGFDPYSVTDGPQRTLYTGLVEGRYPYRIVFDLQSPSVSEWIYPKDIDYLQNCITILRRVDNPAAIAPVSPPPSPPSARNSH
jgi:hypothetical protein